MNTPSDAHENGVPEEDIIAPVSNSELNLWVDCRRRWYITYYLQLGTPPMDEPITGALALGTRVHKALERWYQYKEDPLEVLEELYCKTVYDLLTREARRGYIDRELRKKVQSERELMHAMVEGYVAWCAETGADENLKFAGAEVTVIVASGIPGVRLRGKLDKRVYRIPDGARLFEDYKTAANLVDGPRLLAIDEQTKFYMLLERLDAITKKGSEPSEPTIGGLYTVLRKVKRTATAKPPFYDRFEIHHNNRALDSMWIRTHKRLQEILEARRELDAGGDHRYWVYPHPTRDCAWKCPFFQVCPVMDDSSTETWDALLRSYLVPRDPYARYDDEDEDNSIA